MKEQSERLGKEPIPKLLAKLSIPAMVGMFVMALYNVVDTIFISRSVGTVGVAAASVSFPVQLILMAVAGAVGIGGASVISRMLGAQKTEDANRVFGNVVGIVFLVSLIGAISGISFLEPILLLFGADETILPYASDYLGIILYGTIFFAFGFTMNNIIRSEGNAKVAMLTMIISAGLNMILTPIFIFGFGWGMQGAAGATVISQAITVVYLVAYFVTGKSSLTFRVRYLRPNLSLIKQILAIGSSAFTRQVSGSIMFIIANHMLIQFGGVVGVAVFGIVHRVIMFTLMPMFGIVQGLLPIVGYNYGAKQPQRVSATIMLAMKASTALAAFTFIFIMIFPKQILFIFTNDPVTIEMGVVALRIMFSLALLIGVQMVTGGVFQALGRARAALVLSMSRQVLFMIPLLLTLPLIFGVTGVWLAFPVADVLSFALAVWFILKNKGFFIPDKSEVLGRAEEDKAESV
ncbi:MATE family efflux transporter [Bacillus carboniphilus]|uniref:Multidrug export protein MepA n=1 Tax=Bacillus carboniphilus TaxID=86663 RepID=A0ABN0VZQ9_9BACI